MSHRKGLGFVLIGGCLVMGSWLAVGMADTKDAKPETEPATGALPQVKEAIAPIAPVLPAEVMAAMQEGRYAEAIEALEEQAGREVASPDERAYYALIQGIAHRLEGQGDQARAVLRRALDDAADGAWSAKLRFELATTELASRRPDEAEALARAEVEVLLDDDRKDRLAGVYHGFAQELLDTDDPTKSPDPEAAYELLTQARALAKGDAFRARLLFEMARASQKAGHLARAIQDFQTYLEDYPEGADRASARFHLGEAQLESGQPLPARLTWTDLARDLKDQDDTEAQDHRARALYQIARTYGIPQPPNDAQLNLGVAALRRFLDDFPAHPLAVTAAYEIGASYLSRGQTEPALEALRAFLAGEGDLFRAETDEARRALSELSRVATFQVGQVLQRQRRFDEAIQAFQGYLTRFPDGPHSADAQRAILDTQLAIANDHRQRERFDQARASWNAFVTQNPLDPRVPQVLFQIGESFAAEERDDDAINAWETVISRFPDSEPAAHAQFQIGLVLETKKGDPADAIERFQKVRVEPWASQARQRIALMESKQLTVVTPRAFRSGETPHLKVTTRNLETLTFTAYKLDAEAYFRKKHQLDQVESLDIGLVAPDFEWTVAVPGYARYAPIEHAYDLEPLPVPGVFVVKVTDEKTLQATTLVVGSDIDAIVKASRDQVLVFVQDMTTGQGRPGARVLISDGEHVLLEATTGDDGVLLKDWDQRPGGDGGSDGTPKLSYLILDEANVAGSELGVPHAVAQGLTPRAYLYTDRPAYRPGQQVAIKGIVREVQHGQYDPATGETYRLEVTDSRGRRIVNREVTLSEFGTFHDQLPIDAGAPVGTYQIRLFQPGRSEFSGAFEVQAYQLQKVDLEIDVPKTVYFRGETVEGDVVARYQYGTPLAGRPIQVALPDGRTLTGTTDASGTFAFAFETDGFAEEQPLRIVAHLPEENVGAVANLMLAVRAFRIDLRTARDVYLDGETFPLEVTTLDALGEPTGQELTVSVLKRVTQAGTTAEREVEKTTVTTDETTGRGRVALTIEDEEGGPHLLRVSGTDRFGNPVVAERHVLISGKTDETKLRLLADRTTFKVGEAAEVNLHNRAEGGTALLAWEADRILRYQIIEIEEGDNSITWDADGAQFPNVTLTAARMAGSDFHQARLDLNFERDLRVTIAPKASRVGPGDEVEVEITTHDQLGRPVAAEVSLALIDTALLRLYGDALPPIGPFFYDQKRTGAFTTEATNTFRYQPETEPVADAVVEEMERLAALAADAAALDDVRHELFAGARPGVRAGAMMPLAAPPMPESEVAEGTVYTDGASMTGMMGGYPGMMGDMTEMMRGQMAGMAGIGMGIPGPGTEAQDSALVEQLGRESMAFRLRDETRGARRAARDGEAAVPAEPRQQFVETAYWNPSVVTGEDGQATVTFTAPSALSEYRFTARGVTGADTLVGQTTAELAVRQDFFVDLKLPSVLTQGDRPRFSARVHHVGVKGQAEIRWSVYAGGREQVYPATLDIEDDGVDEVAFEPFEVPDGDTVRLSLSARVGDDEASDELVTEVPIRPRGVQAFASASGTARDDTTVFVGLPSGRSYEHPEMLIVVSPSLQRMLIELALGPDVYPLPRYAQARILPPPPNTTADRAGDLLAATSALGYLRAVRGSEAPESTRVIDRIQGLVAELIALQNEDGGWPWVAGRSDEGASSSRPSDRMTSARVFWALATAEPLGLLTDVGSLDRAAGYLQREFARADASDHETRATLLHALSTRRAASFEQANSLNRARQNLSNAALAYLALTFANLDRDSLSDEVLGVLIPRSRIEPSAPGRRPRRFWEGDGAHPWHRSVAETTALASLALARVRPQASELNEAIDWLLAHRIGTGWQPHKAKGPALAALGMYHGRAEAAEDRYRLVITVNDEPVFEKEILGATEGEAVLVPQRVLKAGDRNRVRFDIDGRGTFGYAVTLTGFTREFGPDQDRAHRAFLIHRRAYLAAEPELDGKPLPSGFAVAVNASHFENPVTQVGLGGRARVRIDAQRVRRAGQPSWEQDFLILEEYLPAGATLIEDSVRSQAAHHELANGVLTFYFAPDQGPGSIEYEVFGYLPGQYRALPPRLRSAYEPGQLHLGPTGELRVLGPGEPSTDPYRPTPDELYARGQALFNDGKLAQAAGPLETLVQEYTLRDDVIRDTARILLYVFIQEYDARRVVQYFEVLKEKAPELVIPFDEIRVVGRAYRDLNEHERAYLVWRATVEASYLEDARVGEVLRQKGKTLEGIAYLLELWRSYPNTASIESDFFGLSQMIASLATRALDEPAVRRELATAEVTRPELLVQTIRLIQVFLAQSPTNPMADEASLALLHAYLDLEDHEAVVRLSERFVERYPRSTFLDSFQYSEALGRFHLGQYDRAIEVAETIARSTYKDATGAERPSPNKWQALYILGQIYDARRQPARAVDYYRQVADRFTDAASAIKALTREALELPETTLVRPSADEQVAARVEGEGFRALPAQPPDDPDAEPAAVTLDYRNIAEADVKVYPVDLMRLYLSRRNLDGIAGIDLAGITPLIETQVTLGDGNDFEEKSHTIPLPLEDEGAYLVMIRGDQLHTSGIVLVSPLAIEVLEEADAGRVRVTVRDARSGDPVPKVQVRVIGGDNVSFFSGQTDLRGVFVAEGVRGPVTAVARQDTNQYAFYRGQTYVGTPPVPDDPRKATETAPEPVPALSPGQALDDNLRSLNTSNQMRQLDRLQQRFAVPAEGGVQVQEAQ